MRNFSRKPEMYDVDLKLISELVEKLEEEQLLDIIKSFIESNPTIDEGKRVVEACQEGTAVVARLFESGKYFVGDVIFAGELLTEIVDLLKPVIGEHSPKLGGIRLGTIHGQSQHVGENIFRKIIKKVGYEVIKEN